jgi:hypothetical protein
VRGVRIPKHAQRDAEALEAGGVAGVGELAVAEQRDGGCDAVLVAE